MRKLLLMNGTKTLIGLARGALALAASAVLHGPDAHAQSVIKIGLGTQHTTTNTVTGGIVIRELKLLEKHLPRTGKYAGVTYEFDWQNATSGPPIINGMMANRIHIGMMGDYPLLVAGATGQQTKNETQLVAIIAYNQYGAGNGIVVHKDSPYYELADLKGKTVSVPFGSAAHGMMLQAVQSRGWPDTFWTLVSQSPEVGTTNLQEKRIDGHGDFVPFAELLPFRGFARKIFDGAETRIPTFHGVVIRKDFGEQYPEIVVAYIKALMEANDWVRKDPKTAMERIEEWTKIEKEVAYVFLGPSGVHTLDPTIKPKWVETIGIAQGVLTKMGRVKDFNSAAWVNERYVQQAYKELGLDYDKQKASYAGYEITGHDTLCNAPIKQPREAGQVWVAGGDIVPFSSASCTLAGIKKLQGEGKKIGVAYVFDRTLGIKLFADKAFYAVNVANAKQPSIVPFLLKKDAEAHVAKSGGKLATYTEALAAASIGR